jgi:hypothetical protein
MREKAMLDFIGGAATPLPAQIARSFSNIR